ncbi:MAG: hypothetical protein R3D70_12235 [Rhizobiaceae bacterium]
MHDLDILTRDWCAIHDMATLRKVASALIDVAEALHAAHGRAMAAQSDFSKEIEGTAPDIQDTYDLANMTTDCTSAIYRVVAEARQREPQDILESIDRIAILAATARYNNDPNCIADLRQFVGGKAVA